MRISILLVFLSLIACQTTSSVAFKKPKSVILFIGDGMGPQQLSALYYLAKFSKDSPVSFENLSFKRLAEKGYLALSATEPEGNIVVDSACSATHLATGEKTWPEVIGLGKNENASTTILEKAKAKGLATGIVSDTLITHATPASFAAHVANRFMPNEIAASLLDVQPDVMLSGGVENFLPQGIEVNLAPGFKSCSKRQDSRNLIEEAKAKGYQLAFDREQLRATNSNKLIGLFSPAHMPDSLWQNKNELNPQRTIPNLKEMTESALQTLKKNEKGFFLMVEAGQIDWRAHDNDAGGLLHEMVTVDKTVNFLIDWVEKNPDTLLIVTADHETGGFGFSYNIKDIPKPTPTNSKFFKKGEREVNVNYVSTDVVSRIYNQKKIFKEIFGEFKQLSAKKQTPAAFQKLVNQSVDFKFDLAAAKRVFREAKNEFRYPWVKSMMKYPTLPIVPGGRQAFYTSPDSARSGLLAGELMAEQGLVWGTGTHTATPVTVFAVGPGAGNFTGFTHHSKIGQLMQDLLF